MVASFVLNCTGRIAFTNTGALFNEITPLKQFAAIQLLLIILAQQTQCGQVQGMQFLSPCQNRDGNSGTQ
jgi:hypothetical protein